MTKPGRRALVAFWEAWLDDLQTLRLLDPACGSGAFLIEAFDQLHARYQSATDRLEELRGQRSLFDPDRTILRQNLYGVDLNHEAIEICRLSIWIKTAQRGKPLTDLDHTVRVGNSLIEEHTVDDRALDWRSAFPEVFESGGFDVVVGNPPYVRQELLGPIKEYLSRRYASYHGKADLYVYFYEKGLSLLKPGGRLSFIVTNKWMKAGYGEALRRHFHGKAWMESVVDLGHAKQIFEDADVFPSIVVARKPAKEEPAPETTRVCAIPRDQLRIEDLSRQIDGEGFDLPRRSLGADPWLLEPPEVVRLMEKIRERGVPLAEYAGVKPYYGIKTGFNKAFLIDTPTKERLVSEDPKSAEIIKPYLRGQDVKRWAPSWAGLWMIFTRRGIDIDAYPAIRGHLETFRERLEPKPRDWRGGKWHGRKAGSYSWYEIQDSVDYWRLLESPKIFYQDITWRPQFSFDAEGRFSNNTVYFLPTADLWLLTVLNSPLAWWFSWRAAQHAKDEALRFFNTFVAGFPICPTTDPTAVEDTAQKLIEIAHTRSLALRDLLDWFQVEHDIAKPSKNLRNPFNLGSDTFVSELKNVRGRKRPLSAAGLRALREEHAATIEPMARTLAQVPALEQQLSNAVNAAYGLTPEEVDLLWRTAPPRMPIRAPE